MSQARNSFGKQNMAGDHPMTAHDSSRHAHRGLENGRGGPRPTRSNEGPQPSLAANDLPCRRPPVLALRRPMRAAITPTLSRVAGLHTRLPLISLRLDEHLVGQHPGANADQRRLAVRNEECL